MNALSLTVCFLLNFTQTRSVSMIYDRSKSNIETRQRSTNLMVAKKKIPYVQRLFSYVSLYGDGTIFLLLAPLCFLYRIRVQTMTLRLLGYMLGADWRIFASFTSIVLSFSHICVISRKLFVGLFLHVYIIS